MGVLEIFQKGGGSLTRKVDINRVGVVTLKEPMVYLFLNGVTPVPSPNNLWSVCNLPFSK